MFNVKQYNVVVGGNLLTVETGKLANLAGGAVTVRCGDTMILATATMGRQPRAGIDFFPLSVDFEERLYSIGKIPGSFFRREGRPSEEAILVSRLIDRPLRPLFPKDLRNEVQIIITALSADHVNPPDMLAIVGASAALTISDVPFGVAPFSGPIGAVRVGLIDGEFVLNPTYEQMAVSKLDLRLAGTREAVLMVECAANEVPEDQLVAALELAHKSIAPIIDMQVQMAKEIGKTKRTDYPSFKQDPVLLERVSAHSRARVASALKDVANKEERNAALDVIEAEAVAALVTTEVNGDAVKDCFHSVLKAEVRREIVDHSRRPDGRGLREIRPISIETGLSPRAHGSGLFTRGETQILSLATLGTPRDAQMLDTLSPQTSKRYMHHYNFPPYSTGEARFLRGSSRREIGHGALAERALLPVLPSEEEFSYTLRVVSEALSSNGSTSMASVCGSTLALMDAGVPIRKPVAGIAMGLVKQDDKYVILTDIQGMEDHLGDMDFKVAGTDDGITALQMDIKITGLTPKVMADALAQAREARLDILGKMAAHIAAPRADLSPFAPRLYVMMVPESKIGAIIGPGGKVIRAIQEETGAKIDIGDGGRVVIASADGEAAQRAMQRISDLIETAEIGKLYTGRVVRIESFGAFVEIMPGTDGLVHISQLADFRVEQVEDVVKLGEELTVMVIDVDNAGKIRLSRQAVLEGWTAEEARSRDRKPSGGGGDRGGRGGDRGGDRGGRGGDRGGRPPRR